MYQFLPPAPLPVGMFLPGLSFHSSLFVMHILGHINYEYFSLEYMNFLQDVTQFSKEGFELTEASFLLCPLLVCAHKAHCVTLCSKNILKLPFFSDSSFIGRT